MAICDDVIRKWLVLCNRVLGEAPLPEDVTAIEAAHELARWSKMRLEGLDDFVSERSAKAIGEMRRIDVKTREQFESRAYKAESSLYQVTEELKTCKRTLRRLEARAVDASTPLYVELKRLLKNEECRRKVVNPPKIPRKRRTDLSASDST